MLRSLSSAHSSPVTTVVFDLGGVLIHWDPERLYRTLIPDPTERAWFLTNVCNAAWNLEQDRGRSWEAGIAILTARFPDQAERIRAYRDRWEDMVEGPIPGTVQLLERLYERAIPLYALTNFHPETLALCQARFDFFRCFRGLVVSGYEGLVKPEPAFYQRLLDRYDLQAPRCLFIDDLPVNVAAARSMGFQDHRFIDPASLERTLIERGLLD